MQQTDGQQWLLCPLWSWKHNKQRLYYFQINDNVDHTMISCKVKLRRAIVG